MKKIELLKIISKALGQKVTENSNVKNTKKWDSLGHLQILASLDKHTKGKSSKINKLDRASSVKEIIKLLDI
jgi:acyl carrier protein